MTLLQDVINGASSETPVATLLRQVKILSSRTGTASLATWVGQELSGYADDENVPTYRGPFQVRPLGHFVGGFGAEVRNAQIPPSTLPHELREGQLFNLVLEQGIRQIEEWSKAEHTAFAWPADTIPLYNHLVSTGAAQRIVRSDMGLVEVHYAVTASTFVGVLDAVRNKVLDLALDLERVAPLAGQPDAPREQQGLAVAAIHNHFHAVSNVAINSVGTSQVVVGPPRPGDVDSLIRYLGAAGVPAASLQELTDAAAADVADPGTGTGKQSWARTRAWLTHAATDTGTGALGGVIGAAAGSFLGG